MPYLNHRTSMLRRRGVGATFSQGMAVGAGIATGTNPQFDAQGRYVGGSPLMDWWCNSFLGSWTSQCSIPTPAQITAQQAQELSQTELTAANQAAAIAAANSLVAGDAASHPADYQAQIAAANHPTLAAMLGPSTVQALFPVDVTDPNNPVPTVPWLLIGLIFSGGLLLLKAIK